MTIPARSLTHTRPCRPCEGGGEVTVNTSNPHGYGPDPQCDEDVECQACNGAGEVAFRPADPLLLLRRTRRFPRLHYYANARAAAMRFQPRLPGVAA